MKRYVCDVCGYVYDPQEGEIDLCITPGTDFKNLPDNWSCPVCNDSKEDFYPDED